MNQSARRIAALAVLLLLTVFPGCAALRIRQPVPVDLMSEARVPSFGDIRAWGDELNPAFQAAATARYKKMVTKAAHGDAPEADPAGSGILVLSGGGSDGAFGAGLLCGWSAHGDRPRFHLVTGVSTGALIAPFAFLGKDYDAQLKEAYTTIEAKDVLLIGGSIRVLGRLLRGDSLSDSSPLHKLVQKFVDQKALDAIAAEHAKGRRLYIGTTNLDAQRPIIWDMGAIASSGRPEALTLFRNILVASAAIPGVFSPVYLDVEAGGKTYDEMHVDGGVTAELFAYGNTVNYAAAARDAGMAVPPSMPLYVIRNSLLRPEYLQISPRVASISTRAVLSLIKSQGEGDIYRLYTIARRDNLKFHLASIPDSFVRGTAEEFDKKEMNRLFEVGFDLGQHGCNWKSLPPRFIDVAPATQP